jgi:aminoglycoside 6'-N-acetyltransferase
VTSDQLDLRPLRRDDLALVVEWLSRPHVAEWWAAPQGAEEVEQEFGPCIDGTDPTLVFVCTVAAIPVGMVQLYRLDDNPDYARAVGLAGGAGIDLFIGEGDRRGQGLGPAIITLAAQTIWRHYPEVSCAMAGPSVRNARSIRAFEKCGFSTWGTVSIPGETDDALVLVCPRPTAAS